MTYEELRKKAPPDNTREFITFLAENNPVIYEDMHWLVIENCKYHKKNAPWLTAFYKGPLRQDWFENILPIWEIFREWEWVKKVPSRQTVPYRFHIHLIKK